MAGTGPAGTGSATATVTDSSSFFTKATTECPGSVSYAPDAGVGFVLGAGHVIVTGVTTTLATPSSNAVTSAICSIKMTNADTHNHRYHVTMGMAA